MFITAFYISFIIIFIAGCFGQNKCFGQDNILRFSHLTTDEGLSQNIIYGIVKDKYGFMWFGTWGGLNRFDGYKITGYFADKENPKALTSNRLISVNIDSVGNIWAMSIDSVLVRYNYDTDDFTRFNKKDLPKSFVSFMDKSINLSYTKVATDDFEWKGATNELIQTNLRNNSSIRYTNNIFDKWAVHVNNSPWMYIDNNKILWIGTYYYGICYADILQKPFHYLRIVQLEKGEQPILDNKIRAICNDKVGNLWIGTAEAGLSKYSMKTGKSTHFQQQIFDQAFNRRHFYLNHIRSIFCDKYGDVWIGSGAGVRKYSPKTNSFKYYWLSPENNEINIAVRSIMEDSDGNLWIATRYNIQKYDRKTDTFICIDPLKQLGINEPKLRILIEDRNKNFWLTSEVAGLVHLKRNNSNNSEPFSVSIYKYSATDNNSLIDNCVYHVFEDETGYIWAGTLAGITRIDPKRNEFVRINRKNGLPDESILGILSDRNGFIWVSHKKGLSRINSRNFQIKNFTVDDGLLSNEFMENACFRDDSTNMLYFGSLNGLVYFNPSKMNDNPYPPKIVLTSLQTNNQLIKPNVEFKGDIILSKPLYLTNEITLKSYVKTFAIEFAALHFSNPQKNYYKYKLEGFDQNWISTDASMRVAKYSNLKPKTYIFKVIASNNDGVWNTDGISLKIIILPPWWGTWIFRLFVFGFIVLVFSFLYHLRIAHYKKRQAELAAMVKERTNELELSNQYLIESKSNIQKYADEILAQNEKIKASNKLLMEQRSQIEEQTEELKVHSENLREANDLLINKQKKIEEQALLMKETNIQLSKSNITKDKLMSIIAHDLKNPFHTLIGFSELLYVKFEKITAERAKHFLLLMKNTASNGHNLLENLLLWSRSQNNKIIFDPVLVTPAVVADDIISLLGTSATLKNITINQNIGNDVIIYADENMLRTILRNLLSNAIKFTNENGTITLNIDHKKDYAELSVSDTGIGISAEKRNLLFQSDNVHSTKGTSNEEGTGLGLLLCKEFVERHKGKIWVESESGKGSTFRFTLPLKRKVN